MVNGWIVRRTEASRRLSEPNKLDKPDKPKKPEQPEGRIKLNGSRDTRGSIIAVNSKDQTKFKAFGFAKWPGKASAGIGGWRDL